MLLLSLIYCHHLILQYPKENEFSCNVLVEFCSSQMHFFPFSLIGKKRWSGEKLVKVRVMGEQVAEKRDTENLDISFHLFLS